jgi:hypothetical protein
MFIFQVYQAAPNVGTRRGVSDGGFESLEAQDGDGSRRTRSVKNLKMTKSRRRRDCNHKIHMLVQRISEQKRQKVDDDSVAKVPQAPTTASPESPAGNSNDHARQHRSYR